MAESEFAFSDQDNDRKSSEAVLVIETRPRETRRSGIYIIVAAFAAAALCLLLVVFHFKHAQRRELAEHTRQLALDRLRRDHNLGEAKSLLLSAAQSDPSYAQVRFDLGEVAEGQGDLTGATKWFTEFLQLKPGTEQSLIAERELKRLVAAKQTRSPSEMRERHYLELVARAKTLFDANRLNDATHEADMAEVTDNSRWEAYALSGAIAVRQRRYGSALDFFQEAMQRAPTDPRQRLQQAIDICNAQQRAQEFFREGANQMAEGHFPGAASYFNDAWNLAAIPFDPSARDQKILDEYGFAKTMADIALKDRDSAYQDLQVLEVSPNATTATRAKQLLANLDEVITKVGSFAIADDDSFGNSDAENDIRRKIRERSGIGKDYSEALIRYRASASQGNAEAENSLGLMYQNGWGVDKDYDEALRWYRKSAAQGNGEAENNIGFMYQNGWGVDKDYNEALRWYRQSAAQGNAGAERNLGDMYFLGRGVDKNYEESFRWFYKSAAKGDAGAENSVGFMYLMGLGVDKDDSSARTWLEKAAAQGNSYAKDWLGRLDQTARSR